MLQTWPSLIMVKDATKNLGYLWKNLVAGFCVPSVLSEKQNER